MKETNKKCSCIGRSMVEMLAVLAVVGILSIGGLVTYTLASRHHRANEILDDVRSYAGDIIFRDRQYKEDTLIPPEGFSSMKKIANHMEANQHQNGTFGVSVYNVDSKTCHLVLSKANGAYAMRVSQDDGVYWQNWVGDTSICDNEGSSVAMEFLFGAEAKSMIIATSATTINPLNPALMVCEGSENEISCLNEDENETCCHAVHPTYAYVDNKCVDKGCTECHSWNDTECVFDANAITPKRKNEECMVCDETAGKAVDVGGRDEKFADCYACVNGKWIQGKDKTENCCNFLNREWNKADGVCCASGTKYAIESKACCAVDDGYEIVDGKCVKKDVTLFANNRCGECYVTSEGECKPAVDSRHANEKCCGILFNSTHEWVAGVGCLEKCDGHRYALTGAEEEVVWRCCPEDKWAEEIKQCCGDRQHVSDGHCCDEGKEWDGRRCVRSTVTKCPGVCEVEVSGKCQKVSPNAANETCCSSLYGSTHEWVAGVGCLEKCDGHRYALTGAEEEVVWRCCSEDKWAGEAKQCCEDRQHVSDGHCCDEGKEWDGRRCVVPCLGYPLTVCPVGSICSECVSGTIKKYKVNDCQEGYEMIGGSCVPATCAGYTLTGCPENGVCLQCRSGTTIKYKVTGCIRGYELVGNTCIPAACTGYPLDACPVGATSCLECVSGTTTKYKVNGCIEGYEPSGDTCVPAACTGYPLNVCPVGATSCSECLSGETRKYRVNGCAEGYEPSGDTCVPATCAGYTLTGCPENGVCLQCRSGTTIKYQVTGCITGYELVGNTCIPAACTGYPLDACPVGATGCSECQSGATIKYKVNGCKAGYELVGNTCVPAACEGYPLTKCPVGATDCSECQSGTTIKYKVNGCKTGYEPSGDTCVPAACEGYNLTACPVNGVCSTCVSGTTTKYRFDDCAEGYELIGGACVPAACTGYDLTVCPEHATCLKCVSGTTTKYKFDDCAEGYEFVGGRCLEECSGNWYALTGAEEEVVWRCCPENKWADAITQCCADNQVVSLGHCCDEGKVWNNAKGKCVIDCPSNRWIEETETCCAAGEVASNGHCCASNKPYWTSETTASDGGACCQNSADSVDSNGTCCASNLRKSYKEGSQTKYICCANATDIVSLGHCCSAGYVWSSAKGECVVDCPAERWIEATGTCCPIGHVARGNICYREANNGICRISGQTTLLDCTDSRVISGEFCRGPSVPKGFGGHKSGGTLTIVDGSDGLKALRQKCNDVGATLVAPADVCGCESSVIREYLALDDKHNSNICRVHSGDYCALCGKNRHEENVAGVPTLCRKN